MKFCFYIFSVLFFISTSCKKDEDTELPSINIIMPENNQSYSVLDTIWIKAKVSDNYNVSSVKYGVTDKDANVVLGVFTKTYNQKDVDFSGYIVISDVRLETGNYSVFVSAFDGANTKKTFNNIYINELPKQLDNIFLANEQSNITNIYELNSENVLDLKLSFNNKFADIGINSYLQFFYILDKSGNLNTFTISNFEQIWQVSGLNNIQTEYNGKMLIYNYLCYVSVKNNNIFAFDINGVQRKSAISSLQAFEPSFFTIQNDFIVSTTYNNSIEPNYIEKFYFETGASQKYYSVDFDVIGIFPLNTNEVVVFGNKNDTIRIAKWNLELAHIQYVDLDCAEKIKAVEKISESKFVFSTENEMFIFDDDLNNYYSIRNDLTADYLFFEELSGNVYCVYQNQIDVIKPPYYNTINTINTPYNTKKIVFNYNR
jgi:hypothetical protein